MAAENFGVTFPTKLLMCLDKIRGDVPRAVFLQRMFEKAYRNEPCVKEYMQEILLERALNK